MIVVKIYMWPKGDQARERLLTQGTISCIGVAAEDAPELGIKKDERAYAVKLFKAPRFGGPADGADLRNIPTSKVWRDGLVRGHTPRGPGRNSRGEWDLIGGALKVLLGSRLTRYVRGDQ